MAFEVDCGASTVLEESWVTRTARFLVPGDGRMGGKFKISISWTAGRASQSHIQFNIGA